MYSKYKKNWKTIGSCSKITQICTWNLGWPMEKKTSLTNIKDTNSLTVNFRLNRRNHRCFRNDPIDSIADNSSFSIDIFFRHFEITPDMFFVVFFQFPGATSKSVQSHRIPVTQRPATPSLSACWRWCSQLGILHWRVHQHDLAQCSSWFCKTKLERFASRIPAGPVYHW